MYFEILNNILQQASIFLNNVYSNVYGAEIDDNYISLDRFDPNMLTQCETESEKVETTQDERQSLLANNRVAFYNVKSNNKQRDQLLKDCEDSADTIITQVTDCQELDNLVKSLKNKVSQQVNEINNQHSDMEKNQIRSDLLQALDKQVDSLRAQNPLNSSQQLSADHLSLNEMTIALNRMSLAIDRLYQDNNNDNQQNLANN